MTDCHFLNFSHYRTTSPMYLTFLLTTKEGVRCRWFSPQGTEQWVSEDISDDHNWVARVTGQLPQRRLKFNVTEVEKGRTRWPSLSFHHFPSTVLFCILKKLIPLFSLIFPSSTFSIYVNHVKWSIQLKY